MRVRDWFNCGMVNKAESSSFKIPQTAGLQSDTFLTFSGVVRVEGWMLEVPRSPGGRWPLWPAEMCITLLQPL